jgi:hypothetical protein
VRRPRLLSISERKQPLANARGSATLLIPQERQAAYETLFCAGKQLPSGDGFQVLFEIPLDFHFAADRIVVEDYPEALNIKG